MCLVLFGHRVHPDYRLVLLANRDEFVDRPTQPAGFWADAPGILAGRDGRAGGTWMGIQRQGRYAALTNYREPEEGQAEGPSRGALVADFLRSEFRPEDYARRVSAQGRRYRGFNLLVGHGDSLWYCSNRMDAVEAVPPGVHGLSNRLLDTPWFKVERGKARLREAIEGGDLSTEKLLAVLDDAEQAPETLLPDTGVGADWERMLSPMRIKTPSYGTRSSTVLLIDMDGGVTLVERTFTFPEGTPLERSFRFQIEQESREDRSGAEASWPD